MINEFQNSSGNPRFFPQFLLLTTSLFKRSIVTVILKVSELRSDVTTLSKRAKFQTDNQVDTGKSRNIKHQTNHRSAKEMNDQSEHDNDVRKSDQSKHDNDVRRNKWPNKEGLNKLRK